MDADHNHWRKIKDNKTLQRKKLIDENIQIDRIFRNRNFSEVEKERKRQTKERNEREIKSLSGEIHDLNCKLTQKSPEGNHQADRSRSHTRGVDAFSSYPNTIQRISRSASRRRNYQTDEENVCTMQRKLDDLKAENEKLRNQLSQEEKRVIEVSRTLKEEYDEELSGLGKQISYLCKELKNKEAALCKLEEHAIPRQRELESGIGENSIAFYRDIRFELDEMKMRSYQNKSQCDNWLREFTLENERLRRENSEMRQKSMPYRQMTIERGYTVGTQNSKVAMLEEELTKLRKRVNDEVEESGKIKRENTTLRLQMKSIQNLREPAYHNSENHKLKEKIEKMKKTYQEELLKIQQNESDMRLKMIELNKRNERLEKESRNHDKEIRALQSNIKAKGLVEGRLRNNIAELQNEIQRKTDEKFDDLQRQERVKTKREETERELLRLRRLEEAYYNDQESFRSHQTDLERKVQDLQDDKEKLQRSEKNHQKENKEMLDQLNGEKRYSAELLLKVKDLERQLRKHTYADSAMSEENMRLQEETNQLRSDLQDMQRKAKRLETNLIHVESLKSKYTDLQKIIRELREDKERIKQSEETNQRERGKLQRQLDKEKEYSAELLEKNRGLERDILSIPRAEHGISEENMRLKEETKQQKIDLLQIQQTLQFYEREGLSRKQYVEEFGKELERLRRLETTYENDVESRKSNHTDLDKKVQLLQDENDKHKQNEKKQRKMAENLQHELDLERKNTAELRDRITELQKERLEKLEQGRKQVSDENDRELIRLRRSENAYKIEADDLKIKVAGLQKIVNMLQEKNDQLVESEETERNVGEKLQSDLENAQRETKKLQDRIQELERQIAVSKVDHSVYEENSILKEDLNQLRVELRKAEQRFSENEENQLCYVRQVETLQREKRQAIAEKESALTRLSALAGDRLRDNNAAIADLSDENRPINLGEKFSELYDNQWTDAIEKLEKLMSERDAIQKLLEMIKDIYEVCRKLAKDQLDQIAKAFGFEERKEKLKRLKDFRKSMASENIGDIKKKVDDLCVSKTFSRETSDCTSYISRSVELCWYMCIQDPPVILEFNATRGQVFDDKIYRHFTKSGKTIDYMVWPVMYLHSNGPLLQKGVVQPM